MKMNCMRLRFLEKGILKKVKKERGEADYD